MFALVEHQPAEGLQGCILFTISFLIPKKFRLPPLPIILREAPVERIRVPEATINEDGNFGPCERDIRSPRQAPIVDPEPESSAM